MKHLVKLFVITFLYFFCTYAFAEQKITYINMKYILNESNAGKNAQEQLQNTVKKDQKKFLEAQKKLKADELDLISKKSELSKEEYGLKIVKTVKGNKYNIEMWDQWVVFSRKIYDNIEKIIKGI